MKGVEGVVTINGFDRRVRCREWLVVVHVLTGVTIGGDGVLTLPRVKPARMRRALMIMR